MYTVLYSCATNLQINFNFRVPLLHCLQFWKVPGQKWWEGGGRVTLVILVKFSWNFTESFKYLKTPLRIIEPKNPNEIYTRNTWNAFGTPFKHPKTPLRHPWDTLETPLRHPWDHLNSSLLALSRDISNFDLGRYFKYNHGRSIWLLSLFDHLLSKSTNQQVSRY